jgi:uncharacterized protein (DUF433 family)
LYNAEMREGTDMDLVGVGLYTLPQAARLASVPVASIKRWMFGYSYFYKGDLIQRPAVVAGVQEPSSARVLTFRDLIEIQFVHAFRREGVSWKLIRLAADKAQAITGGDHPFASSRFVTDGRTIFAGIVQKTGSKELLDLKNDQMAFRRVMLPSLKKNLEIGEYGVKRLWPLGKKRQVVIDPQRQFGQPISPVEGVPTEVLAKSYQATGSYDSVARWYDVSRPAVRAAVDFEKRLAA